ncbi:hypothetical protein [Paraburkholderia nodosa]|uniref:hypothetical protein n=1 Tax=Paraburkholderia nodosa TaxID=392320 RepID=UPI0012B6A090|nr:hypothetical protein [Paraburkholderia nodosa]
MSEQSLRRLAPDVAVLLVRRGQELRHREMLAREERRFGEYWKCFQELLLKDIRPTLKKVQAQMSQQIGGGDVFELSKFHRKALALVNLSSGKPDEDQEDPLAKNRASSETTNSRRKRH